MNLIILSGNLTKDIEIRSTSTGTEVATGSIAVSRSFKNTDGTYDSDFFNFTIWKPTDYQKENLNKGSRALIEGEVRQNTYEDKNKQKKTTYDVFVHRVEIQTKKQEDKQELDVPDVKSNYAEDSDIQLDDNSLPF